VDNYGLSRKERLSGMIGKIVYKPLLGIKSNVPHNDGSLFQSMGENVFAVHAVDSLNIGHSRPRNTAKKSLGRLVYSSSATPTTTYCVGMFELFDGTNRVPWIMMVDGGGGSGRLFKYSTRAPTRISDVVDHDGAVEFRDDATFLWSAIRYGSYMVFTDFAEHTPYSVDHDDTTCEKAIAAGTEFKFRYLESFQRRIIGAYSDQTNGHLEIRWSGANQTCQTDLEFAAANQLFRGNDDPITGIKRMGFNSCCLYGDHSIDRIVYYPNYTTPFGLTNMISNEGAANHHSIVDVGGRHFLFNSNYGFCEYRGGLEFPHGGRPISEAIEDKISLIDSTYYKMIVGKFIPTLKEICWTVPADGGSTNNELWFYSIETGNWRVENKAASFIDNWILNSGLTWTELIALGYSTWQDVIDAGLTWSDFVSFVPSLVMSSADGHVYEYASEQDDEQTYESYRIEPILPNNDRRSMLEEIWFGLTEVGSFNLTVYYRGGDTVGEVEAATWESLGTVSCDSPDYPVVRCGKNNFYHQIKWGSNQSNDRFGVNEIVFKYATGERF